MIQMEQPNINIFGGVYKVHLIEFNEGGEINRVVYQVNKHNRRTVFKGDRIDNESLQGTRKIQKPTPHPYHDYAYAPNLEDLLC